MNREDIDVLLKSVINKCGKEHQIDLLLEEVAELINAIAKFRRGRVTAHEVAEEIADVFIMLEQAIICYDCFDEVITVYNYKIQRLKDRLENNKDL